MRLRRKYPHSRREAAFHEAGHAVALWLAGPGFVFAEVRWDRSGQTRHLCPDDFPAVDDALILVAGPMTQSVFSGKPVDGRGGYGDLTHAAALLGIPVWEAPDGCSVDGAEAGAAGITLNEMLERAWMLLEPHEALIRWSARRLERRGRLWWEDFAAHVSEGAQPRPAKWTAALPVGGMTTGRAG